MKRILISLLALISLNAFATQRVYVSWSWIDNEFVSRITPPYDVGYENVDGKIVYDLSPIDIPDKQSIRFYANIPEGHEVTGWTYGANIIDQGQVERTKSFGTVVETNSPYFDWPAKEENIQWGLGVYLDWLEYTVNFDTNGGTYLDEDGSRQLEPLCTNYNAKVCLPTDGLSRTGYTFLGWSRDEDATEADADLKGTTQIGKALGFTWENKSTTLYAVWRLNKHIVTYNANGGVFSDGTTEVAKENLYGENYNPPTDLSRGGYTFGGSWTNETLRGVTDKTTMTTDSDHTLYAVWNALPQMYISTIKVADEVGANGTTVGYGYYSWGQKCHLQATPSTGSRFVGWTKGSSTGELVSDQEVYDIDVCESTDYYAHFALKEYEVTFRFKDEAGNDTQQKVKVKYDQSATPPTAPNWSHHKFKSWDSSAYLSVKSDCVINAVYSAYYTVTFDANGGDPESLSMKTKEVTFGEKYGPLSTVSREGEWEFVGWKSPDGEIVTKDSTVIIQNDHFLTAQWKTEPYWVTLDPNGGSVSPSSVQVTYDDVWGDLPDPTRKGYEFSGWFTAAVGGEQVKKGDRVLIRKGGRLHAHWAQCDYTITFDVNGAVEVVQPEKRTIHYNDLYGKLPELTRRGYELKGWKTEASGGSYVYSYDRYTREEDQTLFADWSAKTFNVRFDGNDNTGGYMASQTFTWDVEQNLTANGYTRTGYTFKGWALDKTGGTPVYANGEKVKNLTEETTLTLYAVWQANTYTIAFDKNGGLGEMASVPATYDTDVTLPKSTLTWGSNTFKGWLYGGKIYDDGATVKNLTATDKAIATLVAQWSDDYAIEYRGNGATSGAMAKQSAPVNEYVYLSPNAYERIGYRFGGWATNETAAAAKTVSYKDGDRVKGLGTTGGTVNLYAVWSNNTYNVRFFPNGGEGVPRDQRLSFDIEAALDINAYKRENYDFVGWKTDPAADEIAYLDRAKVMNLATNHLAVVSLYAAWKRIDSVDSELSRAADCDRTTDKHVSLELKGDANVRVAKGVEDFAGNGECVCFESTNLERTVSLIATIKGTGTLTFRYKTFFEDASGISAYNYFECEKAGLKTEYSHSEEWLEGKYIKETVAEETIQWRLFISYPKDLIAYAYLDAVWWKPDVSDATTIGVTFRLNDGTEAPADIVTNMTCEVGKAIGVLPEATSEVREFLGWATEQGATSPDVSATTIVPGRDVQYYAVWKAEEHPEPTDADRPVIEEGFKFTTDKRFDYVIWTTTDLTVAPDKWEQYGEVITGDGETVSLPIPPIGEAAGEGATRYDSLFFKVEVIQRK